MLEKYKGKGHYKLFLDISFDNQWFVSFDYKLL